MKNRIIMCIDYKVFILIFTMLLFCQNDSFAQTSKCDQGDDAGCIGGCGGGGGNKKKWPIDYPKDPNDITGNLGYEAAKWVSVKDNLGYKIRYENDPVFATAPAQVVRIICPLDEHLDIFSFRLSDFGFGDFNFQVPSNTTFYTKRLDVIDSLGVYVDVTAGIDAVAREVFWSLSSIDPLTGLAPEGGQTGFLPVNDTLPAAGGDTLAIGRGEGYVSFTIQPKKNALTGDTIAEQASIVFDLNEAIATNIWTNVIDAVAPSSTIKAIPPQIDDHYVWLNWEGEDDVGGVGISHYDLYVSKNNAPFYLHQGNIDTTAFRFDGLKGTRYAFYTTAVDWVGNKESEKSMEDTYTVFQADGFITVISPDKTAYCAGDTMLINWSVDKNNPVGIEFSAGSTTYKSIAQNISPSTQSFEWVVPLGISCTNCTVRITEAGGGLQGSSNRFTIHAAPNLTFTNLPTSYCEEAASINLMATPAGGTFSGTGVIGDIWRPNNLGTYDIKYEYTDNQGCIAFISEPIDVVPAPTADFSYTLNNNAVTFEDASNHAGKNWTWDFGNGSTSSEQNPTTNFEIGTYNVCLTVESDCGTNTKCRSVITGTIPLKLALGGQVVQENERPIEEVLMSIETATTLTGDDGFYTALLPSQQKYIVRPSKEDTPLNALTISDAIPIQKHILWLEFLDSPYKMIAADLNGSGAITTFDIVILRRLILGQINELPNNVPIWRFVPRSYVFPNPQNPFESPFPDSITVNNLIAERDDLDFIGIKTGDVNSSYGTRFNSSESRSSDPIILQVRRAAIPANTEVLIPFYAQSFDQIVGYQLGIAYDQQAMELVGAISTFLEGFEFHQTTGLFKAFWLPSPVLFKGESLREGEPLLHLRFKTKKTIQLEEVLSLSNEPLVGEALTKEQQTKGFTLTFTDQITRPQINFTLFPNPVSDFLMINANIPQGQTAELYLMDNFGGEIYTQSIDKESIKLNLKTLIDGIYHIQIRSNGQHITKRFVKNQ